MWKLDNTEQKPRLKKLSYILWILTGLGIVSLFILFISLSFSDLPTFQDLENPNYDLASIVYDSEGIPFGKYYIQNRENIPFEELSPKIVDALISTEDSRFYGHSGVDVRALIRVAFKTLLFQDESSGGGSTISQQLAKLLFDRPNLRGKGGLAKMWHLSKTKFKEWITAIKLEKSYTKEEIIAMYLNKFEFINGAHGIQAASQIYFNKNQDSLSYTEAATLAGMLKNPSLYNPNRFLQKSTERRNVVLYNLYQNDKLDRHLLDSLVQDTIDMSGFNQANQSQGPAPYFRAELTKWLKELLSQSQYFNEEGKPYNIYTDGLIINTTIDLKYQMHAEQAVKEHMKWNQERYWRAWRGMNPIIFEADEYQKGLRNESINRRIRESDRYKGLWKKHFEKKTGEIEAKYEGLVIVEPMIRKLYEAATKSDVLDNVKDPNEKRLYQKLLKSSEWSVLAQVWEQMMAECDAEFKKEVEMKVFDYNTEGEILKHMTPYDSVMYHLRHLQAGMLAVDPKTGYIKAWVGGVDHNYFKFDHVTTRRQVGSTIKPFVYATAISLQGISPCQQYEDIQYTIAPGDGNFSMQEPWSPANANEAFTGNMYNLYQGLLYSKNSITVRLVKELGNMEVIRNLLNNVGISKDEKLANGNSLIPSVPAISLGAVDLSVLEMTGAYTTFANEGIYTHPSFVSSIEDKNGKTIYRSAPEQNQALNPLYNAVMVDMLKNNTGGRFGLGIKSQNGGKTGTTNDYADAWFMGITPNLVVGTWVGGDEKWVRFFTLDDGQGYVMARPIFQKFLTLIEKDSTMNFDTKANFASPPSGFYELIDCEKYKQGKPENELEINKEKKKKIDTFEEEFEEEPEGSGGR